MILAVAVILVWAAVVILLVLRIFGPGTGMPNSYRAEQSSGDGGAGTSYLVGDVGSGGDCHGGDGGGGDCGGGH